MQDTSTVLPLLILSPLMFGSLFLPSDHVRMKIIVMVITALCGAVPLVAINNQIRTVGYTLLIENVFYVYFALALLCGIGAQYGRSGRTHLAGYGPSSGLK